MVCEAELSAECSKVKATSCVCTVMMSNANTWCNVKSWLKLRKGTSATGPIQVGTAITASTPLAIFILFFLPTRRKHSLFETLW